MSSVPSSTRDLWEFRFKSCSAVASVITGLSIIIGGFVGIHTYIEKTEAAEALKLKELRLMEFQQKRDVYYQLVDAASAVANSRTKAEALENSQRYATLFFGKAHIFAIDPGVAEAKIAFFAAMNAALKKGDFPSLELQASTLVLSGACKDVLRAQDIFGLATSPVKSNTSSPPK